MLEFFKNIGGSNGEEEMIFREERATVNPSAALGSRVIVVAGDGIICKEGIDFVENTDGLSLHRGFG